MPLSWRGSVWVAVGWLLLSGQNTGSYTEPEALGSIPGSCQDIFSCSKLSDIDGVLSSVVL